MQHRGRNQGGSRQGGGRRGSKQSFRRLETEPNTKLPRQMHVAAKKLTITVKMRPTVWNLDSDAGTLTLGAEGSGLDPHGNGEVEAYVFFFSHLPLATNTR